METKSIPPKRFTEIAQNYRKDLIKFLRELIAIPSPSGWEKEVALRVKQEMEAIGFSEVYVDRIGNVVGHIGMGDGKKLLYDAHIDTVGIGLRSSWPYDPYKGKVENGFIYGRGASDNKAAMAAMIYGVKALLEAGAQLKGDLYVAGIVQEEDCDGYAAGLLCQELKPDAVLLGEATDMQVHRGQRGRIEFQITTFGRSCHASAPRRGSNAIVLMNKLISRIEELAPNLKSDPFLGQATIAVTKIESTSASLNVIPDTCTIYIDRRLTLGENLESAMGQIQDIIQQEKLPARIEVLRYEAESYTEYQCAKTKYFPTWIMPENHALVKLTVNAIKKTLGYEPKVTCWAFSTDGVTTRGELGIPTIGFGPGNEVDSHTTNDRVRIEDVVNSIAVYAQLAVDYLGVHS